jgi:hypothetical protein
MRGAYCALGCQITTLVAGDCIESAIVSLGHDRTFENCFVSLLFARVNRRLRNPNQALGTVNISEHIEAWQNIRAIDFSENGDTLPIQEMERLHFPYTC